MKKATKKSAKKNVKSSNRSAVKGSHRSFDGAVLNKVHHPLKKGQKVKYEGKTYEVKRAYFYDNRPIALLTNKDVKGMQVSAKSCSK